MQALLTVLVLGSSVIPVSDPNFVPPDPNTPLPVEWSIVHRLPFDPNLIEPEIGWVDYVMFEIYQEYTDEPYVRLVIRNWLGYNPITVNRIPIGGRPSWLGHRGWQGKSSDEPPLCLGNLNGDDAIDLADFAYAAKYYYGGLHWPSPPETLQSESMIKPMGSDNPSQPTQPPIDLLAVVGGLWMQDDL